MLTLAEKNAELNTFYKLDDDNNGQRTTIYVTAISEVK